MATKRIPFEKEDEERIASAGGWGIVVALTTIASAISGPLVALVRSEHLGTLLGQLLVGLFTLLLGLWLWQASRAFRKVALTDENDQAFLMEGFLKLRNYFRLQGILFIVVLVVAAIGVLALFGPFGLSGSSSAP